MLEAGRRAFEMATDIFFGNADLEATRGDLFKTDKRINRAERQIRRELVVHATVHGAVEFPPCLVMMSIVKDAERIGDYAKNIFDLAEMAPSRPGGEHLDCLRGLCRRMLPILAACREILDEQQEERAKGLIREAAGIEDLCDEKVRGLVRQTPADAMGPTYVLAYRYLKRITSHVRNIASSVVQPVHKLDFTSKIVGKGEARD